MHKPSSRRTDACALLALASTLAVGCSFHQPSGPPFAPAVLPGPDKSLIYFYRLPGESFGYNRTYSIVVNGRKVVDLLHGGYYSHEVESGHVVVIADDNKTWDRLTGGVLAAVIEDELVDAVYLEFEADPGTPHYVKLLPVTHVTHFTHHLYLLPADEGEREIQACHRILESD